MVVLGLRVADLLGSGSGVVPLLTAARFLYG